MHMNDRENGVPAEKGASGCTPIHNTCISRRLRHTVYVQAGIELSCYGPFGWLLLLTATDGITLCA